MKTNYLIGFFLLGVGTILLLKNIFSMHLELEMIKEYWGVIIILIGFNIIFKDDNISTYISSIVGLILSIFIFSWFSI